jgi:hypothetical protein
MQINDVIHHENNSPSRHIIQQTSSSITLKNRWDHFLARIGYKRKWHRVNPGLYSIGHPSSESPVFVTANYTLSFDALRSSLRSIDGYILVLDTKGINVWCSAGAEIFSTEELVNRINAVSLHEVVSHRTLILPQLSASGVAAHEVKKKLGFKVEYGPVRAKDLPEYLKTHHATQEMRQVCFKLRDRLILVPVEITNTLLLLLITTVIFFAVGGFLLSAGWAAAVLAGLVLFPILLPWIPSPNFSTKGFMLGGAVALPFVLAVTIGKPGAPVWQKIAWAAVYLTAFPSITAFIALNFTGSTTFTSRSGVRREIFTYIPVMAWMFGGGMLCLVITILLRLFGAG